jgi:hypothetical protein
MSLVIVPNALSDLINASIDRALAGRPCDDESRQHIFSGLLAHYDEHGTVPEITLTENAKGTT